MCAGAKQARTIRRRLTSLFWNSFVTLKKTSDCSFYAHHTAHALFYPESRCPDRPRQAETLGFAPARLWRSLRQGTEGLGEQRRGNEEEAHPAERLSLAEEVQQLRDDLRAASGTEFRAMHISFEPGSLHVILWVGVPCLNQEQTIKPRNRQRTAPARSAHALLMEYKASGTG